jgi:DNA-binding transcriptional ArsR family regulator
MNASAINRKAKTPATQQAAKALAHPMRMRILRRLNEGVASPVEISREFDVSLGVVAYHVRQLAAAGSIEAVRRRQRRGATETFYRAADVPMFDDEQWAEIPQSMRNQLQAQVLGEIAEHVQQAAQQGGFERNDSHISWTALDLDDQGHQEVVALLAHVLETLPGIRAAAAVRLGDGAKSVRSEVSVLHYLRNTNA